MSGETDAYVQYGCGWSVLKGWRNFDVSPTLWFERLPLLGRFDFKNELRFPGSAEYGDIVKGLPIKGTSCQGVYCSRVLDHLALQDFRRALINTRKLLRRGGTFRFVLPDLEYSVTKYIKDTADDAALAFMRETYLGQEARGKRKGAVCLFVELAGTLVPPVDVALQVASCRVISSRIPEYPTCLVR